MSKLKMCGLYYGRSCVKVAPTEHLPIPESFDFANPLECAMKVAAILSNASGGHILRDVKLTINREWQTANVTANGAHAYWSADRKLKPEDIQAFVNGSQDYNLGSVRTDQYGDGWKRAVWS